MGDPLTQVNALATSEAPKKEVSTGAKVLAWMADNGIFVLTAVLIAVAVIGVEGFASLQNIYIIPSITIGVALNPAGTAL